MSKTHPHYVGTPLNHSREFFLASADTWFLPLAGEVLRSRQGVEQWVEMQNITYKFDYRNTY